MTYNSVFLILIEIKDRFSLEIHLHVIDENTVFFAFLFHPSILLFWLWSQLVNDMKWNPSDPSLAGIRCRWWWLKWVFFPFSWVLNLHQQHYFKSFFLVKYQYLRFFPTVEDMMRKFFWFLVVSNHFNSLLAIISSFLQMQDTFHRAQKWVQELQRQGGILNHEHLVSINVVTRDAQNWFFSRKIYA